jgi:hypothetical protein
MVQSIHLYESYVLEIHYFTMDSIEESGEHHSKFTIYSTSDSGSSRTRLQDSFPLNR